MRQVKYILTALLLSAVALTACDDAELAPIVSLGAKIKNGNSYVKYLECSAQEGECSFEVESNVDYEACIVSGEEWFRFADSDKLSTKRSGDGVLSFLYNTNVRGKRRARVVLSADTRHDTIDIRQHGIYNDFLELVDKSHSELNVPVEGQEFNIPIETSESESDLKITTDNEKAATDLKVENRNLLFTVTPNKSGIPRIFYVRVSYVDGWNITRNITISIRQDYM